MPKMDGLTFLKKLMAVRPMPVVMVSSLTEQGAATTMLPELCQLSLPCVETTTEELLQVQWMERVSEWFFDCQEEPLLGSLWKRQDG